MTASIAITVSTTTVATSISSILTVCSVATSQLRSHQSLIATTVSFAVVVVRNILVLTQCNACAMSQTWPKLSTKTFYSGLHTGIKPTTYIMPDGQPVVDQLTGKKFRCARSSKKHVSDEADLVPWLQCKRSRDTFTAASTLISYELRVAAFTLLLCKIETRFADT